VHSGKVRDGPRYSDKSAKGPRERGRVKGFSAITIKERTKVLI